ncbi:chaperone protein DNAj [Perkinsela sp. CCAP 1560/4]|nr:chaperone protein DNAj [Perkinsela sp. CCAP 1560/4]|eukprot:KNH05617.1 chaperone protein DNAj [Perkinsela sp. CCAP 1560/4]
MLRSTQFYGGIHKVNSPSNDYVPGVFSKITRCLVHRLLPASLKNLLSRKFNSNCVHLKTMEIQLDWLRKHQSPLKILDLTENVTEIGEIKRKYKELTIKHHPDHGGDRDQLERVQAAYGMLMDPGSMWYLDGNSAELSKQIGRALHRKRQVQLIGLSVWISLFVGLCVAGWSLLIPAMERLLNWIDPKFFEFMLKREAVDRKDLEDGKEIDHDPVKLAPKQIKKLKYPGRYLDEL